MSTIKLTEADNKAIVAKVDDRVEVALTWNPSTGYFWQEAETTAGTLEEVEHGPGNPLPGGKTSVTFIFRIVKAGQIQLFCNRAWAELTPPAKLFEVQVSIK